MKRNNYFDDYSEETANQLLMVSKKILNKAELSLESPFLEKGSIWFALSVSEGINNYELLIKKLAKLSVVSILDEDFQGEPIPHVRAHKLDIDLSVLRNFVHNLEARLQDKTQEQTVSDVSWPEYYKWDESGHNFSVGDGKKLAFRSTNDGRWKVFDSMVKRKGDPVRVSTIAEESGIGNEGTVRIVIDQIRDRIRTNGLNDYLKIESLGKGKAGIRGAYRVVSP